jgi:S1-C subfamily serine protease
MRRVIMKTALVLLIPTLLLASPHYGRAAAPKDSVVRVTASLRYPDPLKPWAKTRPVEVTGTGVVIEGRKILTNAHLVLYATEVNVQSSPGADKIEAKVEGMSIDADLALLSIKKAGFFDKKPALPRARKLPRTQESVVVYGFPVGGEDLSVTKGVVSRIDFSFEYGRNLGMVIQVSAAINPGNSGGPAVVDGKMVGLVFSRLDEAENIGYIIPNEEVDAFLKAVQTGKPVDKAAEAAGTSFQSLENATLRRWLKLDDKVKGILVRPPSHPPADYPLREFDVLTKIGDHDIDNRGWVRVQEGLHVPFTYLVPRLARGGSVPVTVLRSGRAVALSLPVSYQDNSLIRDFRGEHPSYFFHGPLVFSAVKGDAIAQYAQMNQLLYHGKSPIVTRRFERVRFPGEEIVVVTAPMFAHKIAKGYRDPAGKVIAEVNRVKIKNLRHLVETLRDCKDEFLTFRFAEEGSAVLVFDRKEMDKVTEEILEENGIAPSRRGSKDMLHLWKTKPSQAR